MTALYNEIDKNAAAWLRQLIIAGHIAPGVVDERDIRDLEPEYVASFTQFHAFAGIGVWSHALRGAGWSDARPVWTGSCPCQPFSDAGKGGGFDDERHLWPAFFRLIEQCRPDLVLGEQVASKDGLGWLDLVHADLEGEGYAVGATDTCAAGFGAPHIRQRLYWSAVADASSAGLPEQLGERGASREARRAHPRQAVVGVSAPGLRLAHAVDTLGRPDVSAGDNSARTDAGRTQGAGDARTGGGLCGLADANGRNAGAEGLQRGGQHGQQPEDAGCRPMGVTLAPADQPHPISASERSPHLADRLDDDDSDGPRQAVGGVHLGQPQPDGGQLRPGPTNGIWGAVDWLHCRDGRWRPVEPGTFPLAHGAAARVGRLRGYGNAIVAPQAQAFVEAVMEAVS